MKLSLGTAQLGLHYGINNSAGLSSEETAQELLETAWQSGFTWLDTSHEYGLTEERVGRFLRAHPDTFHVVAKYKASLPIEKQDELIKRSHDRLSKIDEVILYCVDYDVGKVKTATRGVEGLSVYSVMEAEATDGFGLVHVPASILDGRMDRMILRMQARGQMVLVRSLLLQGLLASDPKEGPQGNIGSGLCISAVAPYLAALSNTARDYGMSVVEMCVRWAWTILPDVAIVGCETPEQARQTGEYWKRGPLPQGLVDKAMDIRRGVPDIAISPRMWRQSYAFTDW